MLMQSTTMMMNPTSVVENNWAEIWRYSQWEILSLSIWVTGVMKRWQNCVAQEEIWFESQTNPIEHFPKFDGNQFWSRIANSQQDEIWKAVGRNPIDGFPKFDGPSEWLSSFEVVSWHFVKEKTPGSPSKSEFRCMGELINQETPLSSTFHWVEACWKFRISSQGVTALVSVSDGKIQRTILILRWGPCLVSQSSKDFSHFIFFVLTAEEWKATILHSMPLAPTRKYSSQTINNPKWAFQK